MPGRPEGLSRAVASGARCQEVTRAEALPLGRAATFARSGLERSAERRGELEVQSSEANLPRLETGFRAAPQGCHGALAEEAISHASSRLEAHGPSQAASGRRQAEVITLFLQICLARSIRGHPRQLVMRLPQSHRPPGKINLDVFGLRFMCFTFSKSSSLFLCVFCIVLLHGSSGMLLLQDSSEEEFTDETHGMLLCRVLQRWAFALHWHPCLHSHMFLVSPTLSSAGVYCFAYEQKLSMSEKLGRCRNDKQQLGRFGFIGFRGSAILTILDQPLLCALFVLVRQHRARSAVGSI